MLKDNFDRFCAVLVVVAGVSLATVLYTSNSSDEGKPAGGLGKAVEHEMAYRARVELINKLYGPIEALRSVGNRQEAMLRLDELIRKYPGEAHGHILKGQLLYEIGTWDEAIASYAEGIKLNGDYVDAKSPLSRRADIQKNVDEAMKSLSVRTASNPDNKSLAATLRKVNYLKSRLAGGCE